MTSSTKPIEVLVFSDFLCPWCWIGHRRLKDGIAQAGLAVAPAVRYLPYEINPDMPKEGISRRQYRTTKFGSWARSQAMDAEVQLSGRALGLDFNFERTHIAPNTRRAHRLMGLAQSRLNADEVEKILEGLFAAYFTEGHNIGDIDVLVEVAAASGLPKDEARAFLESDAGETEVIEVYKKAHASGIRALPTMHVNGTQVSGAQPAAVLADVLKAAENH